MGAFSERGYQVVDDEGLPVSAGLDKSGAQALVDSWQSIDVAFGCKLRIVPWTPPASTPPLIHAANIGSPPMLPPNHTLNLPALERGAERDHLREQITGHAAAQAAFQEAEGAVARGRQHRVNCDREVARLQVSDEAEITAAGAVIADRLKAGEAAPLEPNLRTGRAALVDAEARRDAAIEACAVLDSELAGAKQRLDGAAKDLQRAADAVIRAELLQAVERLEELWKEATPLRQLIDAARFAGFPSDLRAAAACNPPDLPIRNDVGAHLHKYRKALLSDADAGLADQSDKVTS